MNQTVIAAALAASCFMVADEAFSAVVDSGVETTMRHFVFGQGSTASYHQNSNLIFFGDLSGGGSTEPETRDISGSFDAEFSRYWWEYDLDTPDHSTALSEQYWLRLSNAYITGGGDWTSLTLFDSLLRSDGSNFASFSGDSRPCTFPMGPDTSCSGFSSGAFPSASGGLLEGEMTLNGIIPLDMFSSTYYSYNLVATSVPIPAAVWLFGSSMLGIAFLRRRHHAKTN